MGQTKFREATVRKPVRSELMGAGSGTRHHEL